MNTYLVSLIELILFGTIAYFLGKNISIFTDDYSLVNLNYFFWAFVVMLSLLSNFKLYLYFGSVFVIGVLFLAVYIYHTVRVSTFVKMDMTFIFWMLFGIFLIPLCVLLITKRMLLTAANSEAPRGLQGDIGEVGQRGTRYFIESLSDRAYVEMITNLEDYFRAILDKNEIDYDPHVPQLNNMYFKNNIKRICSSKTFIDLIKDDYSSIDVYDECKNVSSQVSSQRQCSLRLTPSLSNGEKCNTDIDCHSTAKVKQYSQSIDINDKASELFLLFIRAKYWLRLILENNCEEDRKIRDMKAAKYYSLDELGFITDFKTYQTSTDKDETYKDNFLDANTINYFRMNNQQGREFLQDHFQTDKYWNKYNIKNINRNPFDIIKEDDKWKWGKVGLVEKCP